MSGQIKQEFVNILKVRKVVGKSLARGNLASGAINKNQRVQ